MAAPLSTNGQMIVPTPWKERILKRDFEVVLGKMLQSDQARPDETEEAYLRSANVQWEGVDVSDVKTMWFSPQEKRDLRLRDGDLVVNEGGDVGRCAVWKGELPECYFQNAINRVRPRQKGSARFLFYWLYNLKHAGFIDAVVSRTTIAHLTAEKLEAVPWPDIPPPEQQRIAAYLDASCAAIDAAVAAKRRQLETLDALRGSIITRAVTRGLNPSAKTRASGLSWLGNIPEHWKDGHLKRYARRIQTGVTPPTDTPEYYEDGTIPWFAPGSFENHIELTEPRKLINERALSGGALRMFPVGSVFVIGIGATIGKVGIIAAEASCNQQIIGIVCDHRMIPRFLAYQLKIYEVVIPGICVATTLPIFNQVQVGYLPIVVPPVSEQQAICKHIDAKLAEVKKVAGVLQTQIATLTAYRKSLIHECVTGQRRITEADLRRAGNCPPVACSLHSPSRA
jgi:type I restriction enzyme S subunit